MADYNDEVNYSVSTQTFSCYSPSYEDGLVTQLLLSSLLSAVERSLLNKGLRQSLKADMLLVACIQQ